MEQLFASKMRGFRGGRGGAHPKGTPHAYNQDRIKDCVPVAAVAVRLKGARESFRTAACCRRQTTALPDGIRVRVWVQ